MAGRPFDLRVRALAKKPVDDFVQFLHDLINGKTGGVQLDYFGVGMKHQVAVDIFAVNGQSRTVYQRFVMWIWLARLKTSQPFIQLDGKIKMRSGWIMNGSASLIN